MQHILSSIGVQYPAASTSTSSYAASTSNHLGSISIGPANTPSMQSVPSEPAAASQIDSDVEDIQQGSIRLLTEYIGSLSLEIPVDNEPPPEFHGESIVAQVIESTYTAPSHRPTELLGMGQPPPRRMIYWTVPEVRTFPLIKLDPITDEYQSDKANSSPNFIFPNPPLLHTLVDLYFTHSSPWLNILHRDTFYSSLEAGLHYTDKSFGALVLLVCATAALSSEDPSFLDDYDGNASEEPWKSAGWKWASQVDPMRDTLTHTPSVYELQVYAVFLVLCPI